MSLESRSDGSGTACGLLFNRQAALSLATASAQVLASAFALNFNKTCGGVGFAAVTGLAKSSDAALWMVNRLKHSREELHQELGGCHGERLALRECCA